VHLYEPECLIVTATIACVAGAAIPIYGRLGFGTPSSTVLGLIPGFAAVAIFGFCARIAEFVNRRCRRHRPPKLGESRPDGSGGPAEPGDAAARGHH
jgi:hypothetical protein